MKNLIYEIITTAGVIDAAGSRILKPFGLTPMTFNILNLLSDGPLSQREISDQVIVAASSITFQVRQLQKKGLVQRKRSDKRTWRVSLTTLGVEKHRLAVTEMTRILDQIRLQPEQIVGATGALKEIQKQIQQIV